MLAWVRVPPNATPFLFFVDRSQVTLYRTRDEGLVAGLQLAPTSLQGAEVGDEHESKLVTQHRAADPCQWRVHKTLSWRSLPCKPTKKGYGGTGIRARVKRITTAYANYYTIPPRIDADGILEKKTVGGSPGWTTGQNRLVLARGSASFRHAIALIAQLGER